MQGNGLDRREFHKLTAAALTGMIAGTAIGCGGTAPSPQAGGQTKPEAATGNAALALTEAEQLIIDEPHTCRGLNSCKNLGRSKENSCAGQGTCASIADSTCGGNNKCKGQGGCGTLPGMNSCEGKGGCHIPLMDEAWTKARGVFETAMKKSGKSFGPAPQKVKG